MEPTFFFLYVELNLLSGEDEIQSSLRQD